MNLLQNTEFDGLFVCLRSQSRPADFADQFGFNERVRQDYLSSHGRDICAEDFDLQKWRNLLGEYLTTFLSELREALRDMGLRLAVGAARGDVLGPPLGNATLQWHDWIKKGLIDELVVNQNSSQCPSIRTLRSARPCGTNSGPCIVAMVICKTTLMAITCLPCWII
jgi:hypothetical protein